MQKLTDKKAQVLIRRLNKQETGIYTDKYSEYKGRKIFISAFYFFDSDKDYGFECSNCDCGCIMKMITEQICDSYKEINIDIDLLKQFAKTYKKDKEPFLVGKINGENVWVNPNYLLDCLTFCEIDIVRIYGKLKPLIIVGENNRAVLMPIRKEE